MNVFISYSRTQPQHLARLEETLRPAKFLTVTSDVNLHPGVDLSSALKKLIDQAEIVVIIFTSEAAASSYIKAEWEYSIRKEKKIVALVEHRVQDEIPIRAEGGLVIRYGSPKVPPGDTGKPNREEGASGSRETSNDIGVENDAVLDIIPQAAARVLAIAFDHVSDRQVGDNVAKPDPEQSSLVDEPIVFSTVAAFSASGPSGVDWLQRSNLGRELVEQVIEMCRVVDFNYCLHGRGRNCPILVSPNTFVPDSWTRTLLAGISTLGDGCFDGMDVAEIGIGTGAIPIALANAGSRFKNYYGFDVDTLAARLAKLNLALHGLSDRVLVFGGSELFKAESYQIARKFADGQEPYLDVVIANVPQVPSLSTGPIWDRFDYYPFRNELTGAERQFAKGGLWLVAQVLKESRPRLRENGSVILVIGGRPPEEHIEQMFDQYKYAGKELFRVRVPQDPGTDISAFLHFEDYQKGHKYRFHSESSRIAFGARRAFELLADGKPCLHELMVYECRPV